MKNLYFVVSNRSYLTFEFIPFCKQTERLTALIPTFTNFLDTEHERKHSKRRYSASRRATVCRARSKVDYRPIE